MGISRKSSVKPEEGLEWTFGLAGDTDRVTSQDNPGKYCHVWACCSKFSEHYFLPDFNSGYAIFSTSPSHGCGISPIPGHVGGE